MGGFVKNPGAPELSSARNLAQEENSSPPAPAVEKVVREDGEDFPQAGITDKGWPALT